MSSKLSQVGGMANSPAPVASTSNKKTKTKKATIPGLVVNADGVEEFKVERIVTKKLIDGVVHYRIKWVGWDSKDNTWEPLDHLDNCLDLVNAFELSYQGLGGEEHKPIAPTKKRGRGRPLKLRPSVKPGQENSFYEEELVDAELDTQSMQTDGITDEILDREFMGPMFRRVWRENEVPLCILGSTNIHGALVHLVRIKTKDDNEVLLEDPYEALDADNCVMVLAQTFNCHFPQMVLKYFETRTTIVDDVATEEETAAKAARVEILRLCRSQGVCTNESQLFRDILQTTNSIISGDCTDSKVSKPCNELSTLISPHFGPLSSKRNAHTAETPQYDKFGLPTSYSDSEESTDEESYQ